MWKAVDQLIDAFATKHKLPHKHRMKISYLARDGYHYLQVDLKRGDVYDIANEQSISAENPFILMIVGGMLKAKLKVQEQKLTSFRVTRFRFHMNNIISAYVIFSCS